MRSIGNPRGPHFPARRRERGGHAILAAALLLVMLAPATGRADDRLLGQRVKDGGITALVKAKLVAARPGNFGSIDVDTAQGVVRLTGTVPTDEDWAEAERLASGTNGVQRVVNDLRIESRATAADPGQSASPDMARHTVTGEVTAVDAANGRVDLRTAQGELRLQFPPASLRDVKRGDTLTVELAVRPADAAR
jgi:hypothetical protein